MPLLRRPSTREKGRRGERLAVRFLKKRGFRVLELNYRKRIGEIDVVAQDGDELVFVEVRTLTGPVRHTPEETIRPEKQRRLSRTALAYIQEKGLEDRPARFDVIAVEFEPGGPVLRHIPDAFEIWES